MISLEAKYPADGRFETGRVTANGAPGIREWPPDAAQVATP